MINEAKDLYDTLNRKTINHSFSIVITLAIYIFGGSGFILWAGEKYVGDIVKDKTSSQFENIMDQVVQIRRDQVQERIFDIQDKRIDGTITSQDKKKLIRLQNMLQQLKTR